MARSIAARPLSRRVGRTTSAQPSQRPTDIVQQPYGNSAAAEALEARVLRQSQADLERDRRARSLVAAATALEGDLYWAGAAEISTDDADQDGDPDYEPTREVSRTGDALFGIFGRGTHVDDFVVWVREGGPEPDDDSKMNCWELVFFSAYRAGLISKAWLVDLYDRASSTGQESRSEASYQRVIGDALGQSSAVSAVPSGWDPSRGDPTLEVTPSAGDVVFFDGMNHVALATGTRDAAGRHEVISLWQLPANLWSFHSQTQKTTIEELLESAHQFGGMVMTVDIAPMPF